MTFWNCRAAGREGEKPLQYGLIAEEVAATFPELVVYNDKGEPETVRYQELTPILLNELQKQQQVNAAQAQHAAIQDAEIGGSGNWPRCMRR